MLKTKAQEMVDAAIRKAVGKKAAVERLLTSRLSDKYTSYQKYLLAYGPKSYGVAYVNVDKPSEPKVTIHEPSTPAGREATTAALKRLAKEEKRLERQEAKSNGNGRRTRTIAALPKVKTEEEQTNLIDSITKSVAASTMAGAQMVPQPTTRQEMYDRIHEGVEQGVKRVIGFQP